MKHIVMKRIVILISLLALLLLSGLGLAEALLAQGPVGGGEPAPGGMPGYPAPDKPIPHHEPGHAARAGSYRTQVLRENELGVQEVVEISGVDAMAADGVDPLAGNYTLVNLDKILMSQYDTDPNNLFDLKTFEYISATNSANVISGSQVMMGNFQANDSTAGDLNGDGQAEQIAAWIDLADNKVHMSIGEMPGSLGRTTSVPAAVGHSGEHFDLLVRGYDDALWHRHYTGTVPVWGEWNNAAGGTLLSAPAVASRAAGEFDVFAVGSDNQIWTQNYDGSNWATNWTRIAMDTVTWPKPAAWLGPTPKLPAPAVVARGNELDLFRRGPDNTLRWSHFDGSNWAGWQDLGGMISTEIGAVSLNSDHIQVFARGVDETLWHLICSGSCDSSDDWGSWQRLELDGMAAGVTIASAPTVVSPTEIYVRGSDKALWRYNGSSWSKLGGELASGVAVVAGEYKYIAHKPDGSLQRSSNGSDLPWPNWGGLRACCTRFDTGSVAVAPECLICT